ncbi:GOLPH3/VPS74 family protein [Jatrophihabitans sp.]|uniref:GOLPH3/VPS74 family protein n=1 Tax=Jatrophihabitans sp. TaxID=1932789 RepID=UPI002CD69D40|nr:GPP34 family phosphoprotein [Jatrophihabitans sp.]
MLIAEELLLLGLDPARGTPLASRQYLVVCLSGALVGELALAGAVELAGGRFVATGPAPDDPLLARVHALLAQHTLRRAPGQLRRLDRALGGAWSHLVDGLVERGVLGRRRDRMLLWSVTRHPVLRPDARDEPVRRVRLAAAGDGYLEPRTAVLLALAGPARLLEVVAPERAARRHARQRIKAASELTPVAPVVKKVIAEMQAATGGAATVAVTATAG